MAKPCICLYIQSYLETLDSNTYIRDRRMMSTDEIPGRSIGLGGIKNIENIPAGIKCSEKNWMLEGAGLWNRFIRLRKLYDHVITATGFSAFTFLRFSMGVGGFPLMGMFFAVCMNMHGGRFPLLLVMTCIKTHIHPDGACKTHYSVECKHKQQKSRFYLYGYIFLHEPVGEITVFCIKTVLSRPKDKPPAGRSTYTIAERMYKIISSNSFGNFLHDMMAIPKPAERITIVPEF